LLSEELSSEELSPPERAIITYPLPVDAFFLLLMAETGMDDDSDEFGEEFEAFFTAVVSPELSEAFGAERDFPLLSSERLDEPE
jgi:hypothetical protein